MQGDSGGADPEKSPSNELLPGDGRGDSRVPRRDPTSDPTPGQSPLALATTQDTLAEHIKKGGFWIYPILTIAFVSLIIGIIQA